MIAVPGRPGQASLTLQVAPGRDRHRVPAAQNRDAVLQVAPRFSSLALLDIRLGQKPVTGNFDKSKTDLLLNEML